MKILLAFLLFVGVASAGDTIPVDETYILESTTDNTFAFDVQAIQTYYYVWEPKKDITVYELALILPIFSFDGNAIKLVDELPPEVKRHFRKEE